MIVVAAIATAVTFAILATSALAVLAKDIFANLAVSAMMVATIAADIDKEYHL